MLELLLCLLAIYVLAKIGIFALFVWIAIAFGPTLFVIGVLMCIFGWGYDGRRLIGVGILGIILAAFL